MLIPGSGMSVLSRALVLATVMSVQAPASARCEIWEIEREATYVTASWNHLGLARHSLRATEIRGQATFSPTDPERGEVSVVLLVSGLSSGSRDLDQLLRGPDFFDAGRYPEIRFRSTGVTRTGDRTATIEGELTVRNVARPIILKTRWNFTGEHPLAPVNARYSGKWVSGFSAEATLRRSDFGLGRGTPLISDEIVVSIEAEFERKD